MTDPGDMLARAEALNAALREVSDLLTGGIRTLVGEGWTEEQAREIVLTTFVASSRGRTDQ